MRNGIFVTGTGTGVGKTLVAASIARFLRLKSIDIGVVKPFATANKPHSKEYRSKDTSLLARAAEINEKDAEINPYFYPVAASPYMAAKICKMPMVNTKTAVDRVQKMCKQHEYVIVEGIGGIMVPLNESETVGSFAARLGLPIIVVTTPILGSINHTLLTIMACKFFKLKVAGIIVNKMPKSPTRVELDTPKVLEDLTHEKILAVIEKRKHISYDETGKLFAASENFEIALTPK